MTPVMLDTSACIEILRGNEPPSSSRRRPFQVSTVVEADLWAGVHHSGGSNERRKVEKLLAAVEVVPFESNAAHAAGEIPGILAKAGRKIGDFDAQIAGHARAAGAALLTKNAKYFERSKDLHIIRWYAVSGTMAPWLRNGRRSRSR